MILIFNFQDAGQKDCPNLPVIYKPFDRYRPGRECLYPGAFLLKMALEYGHPDSQALKNLLFDAQDYMINFRKSGELHPSNGLDSFA